MATGDYTEITEVPGSGATTEQLERLYHRYHTARQYADTRRVLEVACGAGMGLGYLAQVAAKVVGGDYTGNLLHIAQGHYRERIPLLRLDAHHLPFGEGTFDLAIIFEAIYYLEEAGLFIDEADRVLDRDGVLLIGTVNKNWSEFSPSPFSHQYFSVVELRNLLEGKGFTILEFYGAFPVGTDSVKHHLVSLIRKLVVAFNLMPKTLKGRERFKQIFYGKLTPLPPEVQDGQADLAPLQPLAKDLQTEDYKIIYCVARRP